MDLSLKMDRSEEGPHIDYQETKSLGCCLYYEPDWDRCICEGCTFTQFQCCLEAFFYALACHCWPCCPNMNNEDNPATKY